MTQMVSPPAAAKTPRPARRLAGEPAGLYILAFTEAWERFSFYGMGAILPLYMAQALLLPGRVEHVAGFAQLRGLLEGLFGPMTTLGLASQIFGFYGGFMYFTPVFGGIIADRGLGRRRAVMLGAMLMSAGHLAMAFDRSFLLALGLLIVGCGLLKGNISAQVGQFYDRDDTEGRTRGFTLFSLAINIGAMLGPFACGLVAQIWGWHAGFGLAGMLMLLGLATYAAGYRHLATDREREHVATPPLTSADRKTIAWLLLVIALTIPNSIIFYQNANIGLIWIDAHVDLTLFGLRVPTAWFASIDPLASIVGVPPLIAWHRHRRERGKEAGELSQIMTGLVIAIAANLLLAVAAFRSERTTILVPITYDFLLGISFLFYWPTMLSLISRAAAPRVNATMMGVAFLSLFFAYALIGRIGALFDLLPPWGFWSVQVAIGCCGLLLLSALRRPVQRRLIVTATAG
jgi:POT family proton-dependent oligopeptide transporter